MHIYASRLSTMGLITVYVEAFVDSEMPRREPSRAVSAARETRRGEVKLIDRE